MSITLGEIQQRYEDVMQLPEGAKRDKALSGLMDLMKAEFSIPLIQDTEWERANSAIIAMYRKLSMSRSL